MGTCGQPKSRGGTCRRPTPDGGPCRHHGAALTPATPTGDRPDTSDPDAINRWLLGIAVDRLAASTSTSAQEFDYYRRAIQSLEAEYAERHPPEAARTVLDVIDANITIKLSQLDTPSVEP